MSFKNTKDIPVEIQRDWEFFQASKRKENWSEEARQIRLELTEEFLGLHLHEIVKTSLQSEKLRGNIENFIGSVEVPVGLAGPLYFSGDFVKGSVLAPLATSEGALVASACRGAKLLNACGGVKTKFIRSQMTRAPSFTCRSAHEAARFVAWVSENFSSIKERVSEEHAKLLRIEPIIHGRSLSLEFFYATSDAAGQNMTTIATWDCCRWIVEQAPNINVEILRYSIEGGYSGDKKMSHTNFSEGRGTRVIAEAWISELHLKEIMRVSSRQILEAYLSDMPNYFLNGSVACNANVANIVAAMFTATGQDIACVHESSLGQMAYELDEQGMYVSLLMPCLVVGTVGGGTGLPCQNEALKLLACQGAGSKERLAEIIAGFCLALELSTMSAAVEGTFVKAHSQLGRRHEEKGEDLAAFRVPEP